MKIIVKALVIIMFVIIGYSFTDIRKSDCQYVYMVKKLSKPLTIDGNWYKSQWKKVKAVEIKNFLGKIPAIRPRAKVKMMYDQQYLYLIFRVHEPYIKCVEQNYNGRVWEDACVEFFFSPDTNKNNSYFNLEINCCGIPLMHYNKVPRKDFREVEITDLKEIEIAHSLPQKIDEEIIKPVTWTIEYKIPLSMLQKYSNVTHPGSGSYWRANFYKIAENGANPHWISWSSINSDKIDFHLPQFFGILKFQ